MAAATTAPWSRPCTARSMKLASANTTQTHQRMTAVGERKVCGPPATADRFRRLTGTLPIRLAYPPAAPGPGAATAAGPGRELRAGNAGEGLGHDRAVVPQGVDGRGRHDLDPDADGPLVHVEGRLVD